MQAAAAFLAGPLDAFQKKKKKWEKIRLLERRKFNAVTGFLTCRKLFSNVLVHGVALLFPTEYSFRFGQRIGSLIFFVIFSAG